jgi:beta-xylosidase
MYSLAMLCLLLAFPGSGADPRQTVVKNPVLVGADPHAMVIDGRVWIYPTRNPAGGPGFAAFSSSDLQTWKDHGAILMLGDVKWIKDDGAPNHYPWAPAIAEKGGKYYFYYSVGPQNPTPSRIGAAVGNSPSGPFIDSGKPLLTGGNGFEAIDPMVFRDPKTNRYYFYAGGSAGAKLRIFEMADDMVSFRREITVETPPKFTEGPFVHERDGVYYLSYSHGGWRDRSYSVHYATSSTPVGPWRYRGAILESNDRHKGPGHHSVIPGPGPDEWFIVYHRWNDREGNGPYRGQRETAIDVLHHENGPWIRPIVMTDEAPKLSRPY